MVQRVTGFFLVLSPLAGVIYYPNKKVENYRMPES